MPPYSTPGERLCHHCRRDIGPAERVGRRDTCLHCGWDLHCCLNCGFFEPTHHNQCREPQAERQVDKQVGNFCEYFSFHIAVAARRETPRKDSARTRLDALFAKKP
jgi:hypothetical protein